MIHARNQHIDDSDTLPRMPPWVISARSQTTEDVAFLSGAALSHLHFVLEREEVPQGLLRARLALRAAEACVVFSGRPERAGELRDAVQFLRPGDLPGPAGETYVSWERATERPVSIKALLRALPGIEAVRFAEWLDGCDPCDGSGPRGAGQGAPVTRAAIVLETVLVEAPRQAVMALIMAEAALAQALGWKHLVPLLATGLKRRDLRKRGSDLRLACHRALVSSAADAVRVSADLARRTAHLRAVAPKLRAKAAGEAIDIFLTRDAVAPAALPLPERAARRLCDRLIDLGAVRELTGRDTFRLYGV